MNGKFSVKVSAKRTIQGNLIALIPSIIGWAVTRNFIKEPDAILAGLILQAILGGSATDLVGFRDRKKASEVKDH
jgi:hypothetical protein